MYCPNLDPTSDYIVTCPINISHIIVERNLSAMEQSPLEIVAARYNEDVSWLKEYSQETTIYNKGPNDLPPSMSFRSIVKLPNIGRESHTYLHHIVHNYDSLAEIIFFTQGHIEDHLGPLPLQSLFQYVYASQNHGLILFNKNGIKQFNSWKQLPYVKKWAEEYASGVIKKADLSPAEFWNWMFDSPYPETINFVWGAIFAVRRDVVRRREKEWYKRVLDYLEGVGHGNPEEGHYLERFWFYVFGVGKVGVVCDDEEGTIVLREEKVLRRDDSGYVSGIEE